MATKSGNIVLVKGAYQVTIFTTRVEMNITKTLVDWTQPTTKSNWGSEGGVGVKTTKIVDLLRNQTRYTVDGYIVTDFGVGDTSSDVEDKKTNLVDNMVNAGGAQTMQFYEPDGTPIGSSFSVHIDKFSLILVANDESVEIGGTVYPGYETYNVKITIIKGEDYL